MIRKISQLLPLLLLALTLGLLACDNKPAVTDNVLQENVKQALTAYENLQVAVKGGVVTLSGSAASQDAIKTITDLVVKIPGVKAVENKIEVKEPAGTFQNMGVYLDDSAITAEVKAKLAANVALSSLDIQVSTNEQVVTLSGTVKNKQIIDLALQTTKEVEGIKSINNQLTTAQ